MSIEYYPLRYYAVGCRLQPVVQLSSNTTDPIPWKYDFSTNSRYQQGICSLPEILLKFAVKESFRTFR